MTSKHARPSANSTLTLNDLLPVWKEWSSLTTRVPLDRWLRKRRDDRRGSHSKMTINDAMNAAVLYRQLADILEYSYKNPGFTDWRAWDQNWQIDAPVLASPAHFWFWIQLCNQSDWKLNLAPAEKRARQQHFALIKAKSLDGSDPQLFMLWHAVRPLWHQALEQRSRYSQWTGQQFEAFIRQQTQRPPLWLRVRHDQEMSQLESELRQQGVQVSHWQGHLFATGGKDIALTPQWREGRIEVQDLASQQIVELLDVKPGQKVWDACAGAGGKTLAIAGALKGKGAVIATDLYQHKLDELKRRAKRAGIANIRHFTWDGQAPLRLPAEIARQQGFDKILVDAPCTNSGTWRRNPDARWRLSVTDTRELQQLQLKILNQACASLRKDGALVYATCSWQVEENEAVTTEFLKQHPDFELVSQGILGAPMQDSDTMFAALLRPAG